jgi:hypothetical protein
MLYVFFFLFSYENKGFLAAPSLTQKESTLHLVLRLRRDMQIFGKLTAEHRCSQFARSTVNAGASFSI